MVLIKKKISPEAKKDFNNFLSLFRSSLNAKDIKDMNPDQIEYHAYELFSHIKETTQHKTNVRIFNPSKRGTTYVYIAVTNIPFAVGSVLNILAHKKIHIYSQQNLTLTVDYHAGKIKHLGSGPDEISVIRFAVEPLSTQERQETQKIILSVCDSLQNSNRDWPAMKKSFNNAIELYAAKAKNQEDQKRIHFLKWLREKRCIFLGSYRKKSKNESELLGICKNNNPQLKNILATIQPQEGIRFLKIPYRSMIHRPVWTEMITIGFRSGPSSQSAIVEHRVLLLYAFDFFNEVFENVPYLGERLNFLLQKFKIESLSYQGRALRYAVSSYPRDELIHIVERKELVALSQLMLEAFSYTVFRAFFYCSPEGLFANLVIIIPRDNYDSQIRLRIERLMHELLEVEENEFNVLFTESRMAFLFLSFPLTKKKLPVINEKKLISQLENIGTNWRHQLRTALLHRYGESEGISFHKKYADAFPTSYRDNFSATEASHDIEVLHRLSETEQQVSVELLKDDESNQFTLRIFDTVDGLTLAQQVHLLENMGAEPIASIPYIFCHPIAGYRLVQFRLSMRDIDDWEEFQHNFQNNVAAVYRGEAENDGFNRLTTAAVLSFKDISLLRAWASYLVQAQGLYGRDHIEETLMSHPQISMLLVDLFYARFAPPSLLLERRLVQQDQLDKRFSDSLEQVSSLEQDQIFRYFYELIGATVRTNFYSSDDIFSFKLFPQQLSFLVAPPAIEIFVYSADFEGVHLRNGLRARGGIRWSDRRASYREEIYGLFRAQIIKNAIIVPTGAKGGFYIKNSQHSGDFIYRQFISALLELTDNISGKLVHPPKLRIYDKEDSYLVVAPDKGTAGFSDLANTVSQEKNYWLDDAFASSGSSGYNHKDMGITARGAWESIKRHCAELGIDPNKDNIEVIGVGGMAGDVFGNGVLLSSQIKLIAAFNHSHIFIDPEPDPLGSYRERKRLFRLANLSWKDYKCLSDGGGVYERRAKKITLSHIAAKKLGIKERTLTPNNLIRAILQARADLLFFGGIGTYVRSAAETDREAADKANDAIRITADSLKVRVVGEGANLGMTTAARIEFAAQGGKVATDSNDNSGGVHCSDREVNIKILLSLMENDAICSRSQRNRLLKEMTDEVAQQVLVENYYQNLCLSIENNRAKQSYPYHQQLAQQLGLEESLHLSSSQEALTRPQLAILLGYYKNKLKEDLGDCALLANDVLRRQLPHYYPSHLQQRAGPRIEKHPLANHIVAVQTANDMVDNLGTMFDFLSIEKGNLPHWADCFYRIDKLFSFVELAHILSSSPSLYPSLMPLLNNLRTSFFSSMHWLVHSSQQDLAPKRLASCPELVPTHPFFKETYQAIVDKGIEKKHARHLSMALAATDLLLLVPLAQRHKHSLNDTLELFTLLNDVLHLRTIRQGLFSAYGKSSWRRHLAQDLTTRLNDSIERSMVGLLSSPLAKWQEKNKQALDRYQDISYEINENMNLDIIQFALSVLQRIK